MAFIRPLHVHLRVHKRTPPSKCTPLDTTHRSSETFFATRDNNDVNPDDSMPVTHTVHGETYRRNVSLETSKLTTHERRSFSSAPVGC